MFRSFGAKLNKLQAIAQNYLFKYIVNDPATPDLVINAPLPQVGFLKYGVKGLSLPTKSNSELRSLNCHISVGNCINFVQNKLNVPLKNWAATNILQVLPEAGVELNAYYDRASLRFFYYNLKGKNTYFADSADIVAHELGHAILDALRPDFWSVGSLEIWSFHEGFSDIVAMFNLMNYDIAINKALNETKNDLSKSNVISKLAEEVGVLIKNISNDSSYLSNALRDPATEHFKYVNPKNLPKQTNNSSLAAECHSFGRVFSNAWYNMFVKIYNYHVENLRQNPFDAFKQARDESFSILVQAIPNSPRTVNYYSSIAKCMIPVARAKNLAYADIVKSIFVDWNILTNDEVRSLSSISYKHLISNLTKHDVVVKSKGSTFVCLKNNQTLKISDLNLISSLNLNSNFEIEVPSDEYYEFNEKGELVSETRNNQEELKQSTESFLLGISDSIGEDKMWKIENNRLKRNYIY